MIEVRHLTKYFDRIPAVQDLSFSVEEGETVILLGTSGCGKTTTLKMINRLIESDQGHIFINQQDIKEIPPEKLRRSMGYVLQNHGLFPHYTIVENISVVPRLLHWDQEKIRARAHVLLEKFDLAPDRYLSLYPDQLSGGQQQRIGFVRALMANPPIILMDEPLGALDPITRHQIQQEFQHLDELTGKTIVMVTHDISEAIALGDRIGLIDNGQLQQIGTAAELLLHPKNDFVKTFFSGDQLIFQMKALHLKDLLPALPIAPPNPREKRLSPDTTILTSLEKLSDTGSKGTPFIVQDEYTQKSHSVGLSQLLSAFNRKIKRQP